MVNVTTKSGTNAIHGSAIEFIRIEKLDARNFFAPHGPKASFKRNQYGFSIGGPVYIPKVFNGRNRVFFFADYEGTKIRESSTTSNTIPTAAMRTGDFSELLTQRKVAITDPKTGLAFAGNLIPASRLDPLALKLVALYPSPMTAGVASNFIFQAPKPQDNGKYDVRTDLNLASKDNVSWRLSRQTASIPAFASLPAPAYGGNPFDS